MADERERAQVVGRAAYNAGFRGNDLAVMIALAFEESGANPDAVANTAFQHLPAYRTPAPGYQPEYSVGLWQINLLAHPEVGEDGARNPETAAAYAHKLAYETGGGFNHWTSWQQHGPDLLDKYRDRLADAFAVLPDDAGVTSVEQQQRESTLRQGGAAVAGGVSSVFSGARSWLEVVQRAIAAGALRSTAWRVGLSILAGFTFSIGLLLYTRVPVTPQQAAMAGVSSVVTGGAA